MTIPPNGQPDLDLLNKEGDRLARTLTHSMNVTETQLERVTLIGRTLAFNLLRAFPPTVEQVTRRAGTPLHAHLMPDDRGRPTFQIVTPDSEAHGQLPADDLLHALLHAGAHLHPTVRTHLQDALTGDEHHATRALVAALRSKPVMDAMNRELQRLMAG